MVMWIHWNVRGSRPASAFAHLPTTTAASPWSPARPLGPRRPLRRAPFPAGTGPSWRARRHQNSPGKGIARDTLLATASAVSPVRQEGGFVPSPALCPCLGTSSRSRSSPLSPSGTGREVKRELLRLAGKRHRNRRHARGLTLPTGKRDGGGGSVRLPGLQNNPGAEHLPGTCTCVPWELLPRAEGISKAVTVILGSWIWICSGGRFGIHLVGEYCKFCDL